MQWHVLLSRYNMSQESEEHSIPLEKREAVCKSYLSVRPEHLVDVSLSPKPLGVTDNPSMSSNFIWVVKWCQESLYDPFSWWMVPSFGWDAKSADFLGCQLPIKFSSAVTPSFLLFIFRFLICQLHFDLVAYVLILCPR